MMAVPIPAEEPFHPGRPVKLFEGLFQEDAFANPNYDVSLDGSRFLMVQGGTAETGRLEVVLNWSTELDRLIAGSRECAGARPVERRHGQQSSPPSSREHGQGSWAKSPDRHAHPAGHFFPEAR